MAPVKLDEGRTVSFTVLALALDAAGDPHLAYLANLEGALQYRYAYPVSGP